MTMYQALYRKYRPRRFGDVVGQEHVTDTLRSQMVSGRLTHAYMFVGTRGTGKTTCAKILSRAINCLSPEDGEPCNRCVSCIGIETGSILDVLELEAASHNRVDDVRDLLDEAIYTPATSRKRVYIVDEVQMYTGQAFNALLKILEEPYEHLLFILATTELHKVPATIQSRCQKFSFKRLSPGTIAGRLNAIAEKEGFTLTPEAAEKLSSLADGSMRDGISLLDQCATVPVVDISRVLDTIGLAGKKELVSLAHMIVNRDTASALGLLDTLYNDGRDMAALLNELAAMARDLLVYKLSPSSTLIGAGINRADIDALSKSLTPERLFSCLDVIKDSLFSLSRGGSSKLATEMCLIRMCDERLSDNASALLARLARLENSEERTPITTLTDTVNVAQTEEDLPIDEPVTNDNDTDFWSAILNQLKGNPPVYALLNDDAKVQAEFKDNMLIIRARDVFTAGSIEKKEFFRPLKDAAVKVFGREVAVRVETNVGEF
jgi:DNA polymerase-3 subunit gamma/tau